MPEREPDGADLAQTATAVGSSPPRPDGVAPNEQLGRYKIQRELGRGGMGVVYAVFDPDLERKVALKVLRGAGDSAEARQRLLREARAMARLAHPNVLTVHEVGSASGHDFIAMELVEGATLDDWLTAEPRTEREIIAAFIAAGRGLAAAHTAGLVHRDFKPRNVLRHKDGRIVVTDFGLVVGVAQDVDVLTTTLPAGATADSTTTPSSLSGLTQTGALLGTPAYMAPEQWAGGAIGPPADQFAFCVALWEALAKERPYKGTTLDALKAEITQGSRADEAKLPRRMRGVLRRGLDPDPKKRYPSMDALLAAITRAERRPGVAVAIIAGAVVVAAIVVAFVHRPATSLPITQACRPPALEPETTWTTRDAQLLADAHQALGARELERDFATWTRTRVTACKDPEAEREARLACLDGVLVRFSAIERATLSAKGDDNQEVANELLDPAICLAPRPPRLTRADLFDVYVANIMAARVGKTFESAAKTALLERTAKEPCASAMAHLVVARQSAGPESRQRLDEADRAAESCGDDRITADIALYRASLAVSVFSPTATEELAKADALVARVTQPDLTASLALFRGVNAVNQGDFDQGIESMTRAVTLYEQRNAVRSAMDAELRVLGSRSARAHPDDLATIEPSLRAMRSRAVAELGPDDQMTRTIDSRIADWMWKNGDIVGADALRTKAIVPTAVETPRDIVGRVVDEHGVPVAGAEVAAGSNIHGDSLYAAVPLSGVVRVISRSDGTFELHDIPSDSICIAQLGDRRSLPAHVADGLTMKVMPTSHVAGHVDLKGKPAYSVSVVATDASLVVVPYGVVAPVLADGSFSLTGVPRGKDTFRVASQLRNGGEAIFTKDIVVEGPTVANVQLAVMQGRDLDVLVRSMVGIDIALAQVAVVPGKQPADTNALALSTSIKNAAIRLATPLTGSEADAVRKVAKPGDLYAKLGDVTDGDASACAISLPPHPEDPKITAILADPRNLPKIPVHCTPVKPGDTIVVASVPPWPRFD